MRLILAAALVLAAVAGAAASERPPGVYLADVLQGAAGRAAFADLMDQDRAPPAWLARFVHAGAGVDMPFKLVRIEGDKFHFARVCKPRACWRDEINILFTADMAHAWGYRLENGAPHWIGTVPPAVKRAILDAQAGQ